MYFTKSYRDYMKSAKWRKKRQQALNKHGRRCKVCGVKKRLQVHHKKYPKKMGTEPLTWLIPLCKYHHMELHAIHKSFRPRPNLAVFTDQYIQKRRKSAVYKGHKKNKRGK